MRRSGGGGSGGSSSLAFQHDFSVANAWPNISTLTFDDHGNTLAESIITPTSKLGGVTDTKWGRVTNTGANSSDRKALMFDDAGVLGDCEIYVEIMQKGMNQIGLVMRAANIGDTNQQIAYVFSTDALFAIPNQWQLSIWKGTAGNLVTSIVSGSSGLLDSLLNPHPCSAARTTTTTTGSGTVNTTPSTIPVTSTAGFPSTGTFEIATSTPTSTVTVTYTGTSGGNSFTGCTIASGSKTYANGANLGIVVFTFLNGHDFSGTSDLFNAIVGAVTWTEHLVALVTATTVTINDSAVSSLSPGTGWAANAVNCYPAAARMRIVGLDVALKGWRLDRPEPSWADPGAVCRWIDDGSLATGTGSLTGKVGLLLCHGTNGATMDYGLIEVRSLSSTSGR